MTIAISVSLMANNIAFANNDIKVTLNGNQIQFDEPPIIRNDRTLVPIRAIFEAMGMFVSWDNDTKKILALGDDWAITMQIDSKGIAYGSSTSGSSMLVMDVAPCIINGRTYVPVRYIAEVTGYEVNWDGANKTVVITGSQSVPEAEPEAAQDDNYTIPETYEVKGSFEYYSAFPDVLDYGKLNNVACRDEQVTVGGGYKYIYPSSGKDVVNYVLAIKSLGYEMVGEPDDSLGTMMTYAKGNTILFIHYIQISGIGTCYITVRQQ